MKKNKILTSILLSIIIILSSSFFMTAMIKNKKDLKPLPKIKEIESVEIFETVKSDKKIELNLTGSVSSFSKADISAEVYGKIIEINPKIKQGGYIKKNEFIFKTDPLEYEVVEKKTLANLRHAQAELEILKSQAQTAENEWNHFNKDLPPPNPLVFKTPQIKAAKADIFFLKAELLKAKKDLLNTSVYSPFDAIVLNENIETGVYASRGQSLLTIIKADERQIIFPVSLKEFDLLTNQNNQFEFSKIKIHIPFSKIFFEAEVTGMLPAADNETKLYKIMAESKNLYKKYGEKSFFLAENSFVTGKIFSKTIKDCFTIPSKAIRKNLTVWILDNKNRLQIKQIELISHDNDFSVIKGSFKDREKFITSLLNFPVENMELKEKIK